MSQQKNDKNRWCVRLRKLTQHGFSYFVYNAFWTPSPTLPTTYKKSQYTFRRVHKSFHTLHSHTGTKKNILALCATYTVNIIIFPELKKITCTQQQPVPSINKQLSMV
jgi:hypothetical protein